MGSGFIGRPLACTVIAARAQFDVKICGQLNWRSSGSSLKEESTTDGVDTLVTASVVGDHP